MAPRVFFSINTITFDILCVFPFFFYLIKLLNFLSPQVWLKNLFILFAGLFFYPVGPNTATDFISLSCMLAGLYYLLQIMISNELQIRYIMSAALALFLACLFRYNYIPVVFCCPVFLAIAGYFNKKKYWLTNSLYVGTLVIILMCSLLIFQHLYTGAATYINSRETGIYPENLTKIYPFVLASLSDLQTPLTLFSNIFGVNYFLIGTILLYLGIALFVTILLFGLNILFRKKLILQTRKDLFLYFGMVVSTSTLGLLIFLSLRNSAVISPLLAPWTYVEEFRYFVFVVLFIQIIIFIYLFDRFAEITAFWKKIAIVCGIIMMLGSLHRGYYISKLFFISKPLFHTSQSYSKYTLPVLRLIKNVQQRYQNYEIVIASPDPDICNYARLHNIKVVHEFIPEYLSNPIAAKTPTKILVSIPQKNLHSYSQILKRPLLLYYGEVQSHYFYILDVSHYEQ